MSSIYTHVSCHGFFPIGHKEFGILLITDSTMPLTWSHLHSPTAARYLKKKIHTIMTIK
jgi:hypothetical protein